jgi:hypothetical protein
LAIDGGQGCARLPRLHRHATAREGKIPCGSGQHASLLQYLQVRPPSLTQAGMIPQQDIRQTQSNNRVASAHVIDKKASQLWICTARYNFQDLTANHGGCAKLPDDIGRPWLSEAYDVRAVTGSGAIGAYLPVFWFIELTSGEIQFCAIRHGGLWRANELALTSAQRPRRPSIEGNWRRGAAYLQRRSTQAFGCSPRS